jgi:hypothetical protein
MGALRDDVHDYCKEWLKCILCHRIMSICIKWAIDHDILSMHFTIEVYLWCSLRSWDFLLQFMIAIFFDAVKDLNIFPMRCTIMIFLWFSLRSWYCYDVVYDRDFGIVDSEFPIYGSKESRMSSAMQWG